MKFTKYYICCFFFLVGLFSLAQLPEGFVYAEDIIPDLNVELRYFTDNNFVGTQIDGYHSNKLILTEKAATALKLVQEELLKNNMCLQVYDGYRPQQAVNHFMRWAKSINDTINKKRFYPDILKKDLFKEGYIASKSGHSRGSTVDLTIVNANTNEPLDMGGIYDFFGSRSWTDYDGINEDQKANRQLLKRVMQKHGFVNFYQEWWHYTLNEEPFPETYFDFVIE
ncbi:M15 family metallopeptidase [Flavobacteriaceae bacterium XHP0103]|nr:M15 family metallopeptidase [Marixanthotalea marina]